MRRAIALILAAFALGSASLAGVGDVQRAPNETGPNSAGAFNRWLFSSDAHNMGWKALEYAAFQTMLEEEGVAGIVPTWQLWRVDADYAARCGTEYFAVVPEERWRDIVPALKLIRDEVIPVTGPVEVVSAYRTPEINECVNGASASKHLGFSAVDLVASESSDREDLFADLCALHAKVGQANRMGLGAYYDPSDPNFNQRGRFHIDAEGFRNWGRDYTRATSPCG